MKLITSAILTAILATGCASVKDSPPPVVDAKAIPTEKLATFSQDEKECRKIQEKAMPTSFLEVFGSSDVKAYERARAEKASTIIRNCLQGRGYAVLY